MAETGPRSLSTRVLLIEENPGDALLVCQMLRRGWGGSLVISQVERLRDAMEEMQAGGFACILAGSSGGEPARDAIHRLRAGGQLAPIVVLTEREDEEVALDALRAGAEDVLVKPYLYPAQLARTVKHAIERKRSEAKLAHLALHDPLTGLPNRALFLDRLTVALDRLRRSRDRIAVLFLDVDNFKEINDSLGHAAGDRVLAVLADRLRKMLRPTDTVARFGGDEFTFLFGDLDGEHEAVLVAERISRIVSLPIVLDKGSPRVTVSIGLTTISDPEISPETVIQQADAAMYRAKEERRAARRASPPRTVAASPPDAGMGSGVPGVREWQPETISVTQAPSPEAPEERERGEDRPEHDPVGQEHGEDRPEHDPGWQEHGEDWPERDPAGHEHGEDWPEHDPGWQEPGPPPPEPRPEPAARPAEVPAGPHEPLLTPLEPLAGSGAPPREGEADSAPLADVEGAAPDVEGAAPDGERAAPAASVSDLPVGLVEREAEDYRAPGTEPRDWESERLLSALESALERSELRVHYQPKVSLHDSSGVIGLEALVRWQHPQRGLLDSDDFIGLAEESGLIVPIGRYVIERALQELSAWRVRHPRVTISINLSPAQLRDAALPPALRQAIEAARVEPEALCIEVPERALAMGHVPLQTLGRMKALGVCVAIDDFGTGTSSLHELRSLPIDVLKLDASLIGEIDTSAQQAALVGAVVELGHALGLRVAAEGVETEPQMAELQSLGCDEAQGFFFSRPVPPDQVEAILSVS